MNSLAALSFFPKLNNRRFMKLAAYFSDLNDIWPAEFEDLARAGLEQDIAHELVAWRDQKPLSYYEEILSRNGVYSISLTEKSYPKLLKEIPDAPHTIFIRGTMPNEARPALGVVGTRKVSDYGRRACEEIVDPLARGGIVIVSGLALGLDGIAHDATIKAGGITSAILGSGVDRDSIYPAAHRLLAEKIIDTGGAIISEYPPGTKPTQYSFPERNRIIAGLTLGTLVVEAPESSGALITAKCALDYNREVMAVPHPITSANGLGANNLLKQGAKIVTTAEDVIEHLNLAVLIEETSRESVAPLSENEIKILNALAAEPVHLDFIIRETGLDSKTVGSIVALMEIKGLVRNLGGMRYTKR